MKKTLFLFGFFFTILISTVSGFALPLVDIEAALGCWLQSPSGDFSYVTTETNSLPSTLDLEKELKYDDEKGILGRVKVDLPIIPTVYVMAAPMMFEGNGLKNADFQFGDQTIRSNTAFYSKITLNQYDATLYYPIPFLKSATGEKLNVDIGINARIIDTKAEIHQDAAQDTPAVNDSESAILAVPTLFVAAQFVPHERLALEVEGKGLQAGDNSVYSFIGRLRVNIIGPAFIAGGYRHDVIDVDESDVRIDAQFAGPFLEVGLKF
ncbi:MAG: TIGR04219 family outer membrane beta-barrel protein [Thermodesulfobacteriota bacterium]